LRAQFLTRGRYLPPFPVGENSVPSPQNPAFIPTNITFRYTLDGHDCKYPPQVQCTDALDCVRGLSHYHVSGYHLLQKRGRRRPARPRLQKTPFFEKVVNSICTSQLVTYYLYPIYLLFFSPRDKSQRPQFLGLVKP
jgi:hypothetical protein